MKNLLFSFSLVFVALFFAACESDEAKTIVEDNRSFDELKEKSNKTYTLNTTSGEKIVFRIEENKITSEQLNGKTLLINFWATWCKPCEKEIPAFNELYEKYGENFEIIGVLFEKDKDPKELADFMARFNMKFPVTVGEENFRLAKTFDDVKMVPESYLYDKNGNFVKNYIGEVDQKDLEEYLKQ